jgi:hypothetical protein
MKNKKTSALGGKRISNKAKLYFALGGVAVLTIVTVYFLLQSKKVSVEISSGENSIASSTVGPYDTKVKALFRGSGAWITDGPIKNEYITSPVFDWYIAKYNTLENSSFPNLNGKPLVLANGFNMNKNERDIAQFKNNISKYRSRISAVVWDYEFANTTQKTAEKELGEIYAYAHSLGLPFGVVVFPTLSTSKNCGVDYARAYKYSDFLIPMMYCQWKSLGYCLSPDIIQTKWTEINNGVNMGATSIPIIPLAAIQTTGNDVAGVSVTPQQLISNYGALNPHPISIGYWNPVLTQELVTAISSVENQISPPAKCSDGTSINTCSMTKPKYCNASGILKDKCSLCSCPIAGQTCNADGICSATQSQINIWISFPQANATISGFIGNIVVNLSRKSYVGVTSLEYYYDLVDSAHLFQKNSFSAPSYNDTLFFGGWDTTKVSNGTHNIIVRAFDTSGGIATAQIPVVIRN